jgi:hypothetical protein
MVVAMEDEEKSLVLETNTSYLMRLDSPATVHCNSEVATLHLPQRNTSPFFAVNDKRLKAVALETCADPIGLAEETGSSIISLSLLHDSMKTGRRNSNNHFIKYSLLGLMFNLVFNSGKGGFI